MPTSIMSHNATPLTVARHPQHTIRRTVVAANVMPVSLHRQPAPLPSWHASSFMGQALARPEHKKAVVQTRSRESLVCKATTGPEIGQIVGTLVSLGFPLMAIIGIVNMMRYSAKAQQAQQSMSQANSPFSFGKFRGNFEPKAGEKTDDKDVQKPSITFADVAGIDEAKQELEDIVDFLKNPDKYAKAGATMCKGCLLDGPPGTGKTLLAKAVAGEAGVPFIVASGSEFDEMLVGVGASRLRDLFEKAKAHAPAIIFIDEIDAVARKRDAGMMGGNNQTINQLLTEMDGFEKDTGVIVLAATNRPDVLDPAVMRPGRFDRHVTVNMPDTNGRFEILKVHARNKHLAEGIDLMETARRTAGFSGADLQYLLNEAAILSVKADREHITSADLNNAYDRIVAGIERPNAATSEHKRKLVSYHEAGHAILSGLVPDYDICESVSILPRGRAEGLTFFAPKDGEIWTRQYLISRMIVALGGRVAETEIFGKDQVTVGAAGDLQTVTSVVKKMVLECALGENQPQMAALNANEGGPLAGGYQASEGYAREREKDMEALVNEAHQTATKLIRKNMGKLHGVAKALMEKEKIDGAELRQIMATH